MAVPTPTVVPSKPFNEYVLDPSSGRVYVLQNGTKRWVPSTETFESLGFKLENLRAATNQELAYTEATPLPVLHNGDLISVGGHIFILENGTKRRLTLGELGEMNVDWSKVRYDVNDLSLVNTIPFRNGQLVRMPTGEIYMVADNVLYHVPNMAYFVAHGYKWELVFDSPPEFVAPLPKGTPLTG